MDRRAVPPQIPLGLPMKIECWQCGLVQVIDKNAFS
jgi:hypothetical protein